jgi:dipeptide/tripeptide permease
LHTHASGNELCERLAYYGLATNLVTYITQVMGGDPAFAAIMVSEAIRSAQR